MKLILSKPKYDALQARGAPPSYYVILKLDTAVGGWPPAGWRFDSETGEGATHKALKFAQELSDAIIEFLETSHDR